MTIKEQFEWIESKGIINEFLNIFDIDEFLRYIILHPNVSINSGSIILFCINWENNINWNMLDKELDQYAQYKYEVNESDTEILNVYKEKYPECFI